jgi:hypothetical protein
MREIIFVSTDHANVQSHYKDLHHLSSIFYRRPTEGHFMAPPPTCNNRMGALILAVFFLFLRYDLALNRTLTMATRANDWLRRNPIPGVN